MYSHFSSEQREPIFSMSFVTLVPSYYQHLYCHAFS